MARSSVPLTHASPLPQSKDVTVIDGKLEGIWSWTGLNFVLGNLGPRGGAKQTSGIMDMGGGSAQVVFELAGETDLPSTGQMPPLRNGGAPHAAAKAAMRSGGSQSARPRGCGIASTTFTSRRSWVCRRAHPPAAGRPTRLSTGAPGFGANEARRRYVHGLLLRRAARRSSVRAGTGAEALDPCMPRGLVDEWPALRLGEGTLSGSLMGTGNFKACRDTLRQLVDHPEDKSCGGPCVAKALPSPPHGMHWVGESEFWYTMNDVLAAGGRYDSQLFANLAASYCSRPWAGIEAQAADGGFPHATMRCGLTPLAPRGGPRHLIARRCRSRLKSQCFKSAWISTMLHEGYRLPSDGGFESVSVIKGSGRRSTPPSRTAPTRSRRYSVDWTLGAALVMLDAEVCASPAASGVQTGCILLQAAAMMVLVGAGLIVWLSTTDCRGRGKLLPR